MSDPLVLGIETSCDETGVGIVRGRELLADVIASQVDEHARFGGVVPEVASRAHLEAMQPTVERALAKAGVGLRDLDAIAVTTGPGLAGALLVGVAAAKAYALSLGVPLVGVNHLAAHVAVDVLEHGPLPEPCVALLVSGGHSSLLLVRELTDVEPLGATVDDAAGEAFDKVARVLGLPFPGGPHVDREARAGDRAAIPFPRGKADDGSYDFSFSGLKTAVARWVEARERAGEPVPVADVAASFQEAVCDVLVRKVGSGNDALSNAYPWDPSACPEPADYCVGKVNSQGCTPAIHFVGSPSASSANPFLITADQVLNNKTGFLIYGFTPAATPFQGGTLCFSGALKRTPASPVMMCSMRFLRSEPVTPATQASGDSTKNWQILRMLSA